MKKNQKIEIEQANKKKKQLKESESIPLLDIDNFEENLLDEKSLKGTKCRRK